ncbi:sigma factor [Cellulosimicrobium sp. CUA-896]|uniref:sigma factor n=1 Tax=Cellulosimicrobium sp. CUA-896 TaxID=1517881 RepID=UPI0011154535|nr:sigma factor [Cellulosimicrobium sp. CUA-896]
MRTEDLADLGDVELADAVRAGHVEAYAVLWERHAAAGRAAARRLTSTYDPDDVVQEAYLRILRALQQAPGPPARSGPTCTRRCAGWPRRGPAPPHPSPWRSCPTARTRPTCPPPSSSGP